jgi:hypothetical protein
MSVVPGIQVQQASLTGGSAQFDRDVIAHVANVLKVLQLCEVEPDSKMFFDRQYNLDVIQGVPLSNVSSGGFIFQLNRIIVQNTTHNSVNFGQYLLVGLFQEITPLV